MIDRSMIKNKIARMQEDLSHLQDFKDYTFDDIVKSYNTHKAVERIIEVIINEAIDINQHIIAEQGKKELAFNFRESFLLLADIEVYPKDFAEEISKSVGLRNILVHEYQKLDEHIFYNAIQECFAQYTKYCRYILDYLS